jgi:hypothetical protein
VPTGANTELTNQLKNFQVLLINDLEPKQFADLYAQTLAYGLFAARYRGPTLSTFDRNEAASLVPKSIPLLRNLFQAIAVLPYSYKTWVGDIFATTKNHLFDGAPDIYKYR